MSMESLLQAGLPAGGLQEAGSDWMGWGGVGQGWRGYESPKGQGRRRES